MPPESANRLLFLHETALSVILVQSCHRIFASIRQSHGLAGPASPRAQGSGKGSLVGLTFNPCLNLCSETTCITMRGGPDLMSLFNRLMFLLQMAAGDRSLWQACSCPVASSSLFLSSLLLPLLSLWCLRAGLPNSAHYPGLSS